MTIRVIHAVGSAILGSLLATLCVNTGIAGPTSPAATTVVRLTTNALDSIVLLASKETMELSIDPELVTALGSIAIEETSSPSDNAIADLATQLRPHGYVIVPVLLTPTRQVQFIARRDSVIYCAAIGQLKTGNIRAALDALDSVQFSSSEFGSHCRDMRDVFSQTRRSNRAIAQWETSIREGVQGWKVAQMGITTGRAAVSSSFRNNGTARHLGDDIATSFTGSCTAHAFDSERIVQSALQSLLDEVGDCNQTIGLRFHRAYRAGLYSEAQFWFETAIANLDRYEAAVRIQRRSSLQVVAPSPDGLRDTIMATRLHLRKAVDAADVYTHHAMSSLTSGNERSASAEYSKAFLTDRANPLARVGTGYCLLQEYTKSPQVRIEYEGLTAMEQPKDSPAPIAEPVFDIQETEKVFKFGAVQRVAQVK